MVFFALSIFFRIHSLQVESGRVRQFSILNLISMFYELLIWIGSLNLQRETA